MKTIIAPVDLTGSNGVAMDYAIDLANRHTARLILVNAYHTPNTQAGMLVNVDEKIRIEAEKDMKKLAAKVRPQLAEGVELTTDLRRGDIVPALTSYAKRKEADLVIMGTKGSSTIEEIFSGSVTNGLIQRGEMPVLAVPVDATTEMKPFKKIVMAVDGDPLSGPEVTRSLVYLAKTYNAHIDIFHKVMDDDIEEPEEKEFDLFLEDVPHSYHFQLTDEPINAAIQEFCEDHDADLLCMIHRERNLLSRIFRGSRVKKETFNSEVPLLILHDKSQ
jgi:nucleotide-binding universal stress UspA family protein